MYIVYTLYWAIGQTVVIFRCWIYRFTIKSEVNSYLKCQKISSKRENWFLYPVGYRIWKMVDSIHFSCIVIYQTLTMCIKYFKVNARSFFVIRFANCKLFIRVCIDNKVLSNYHWCEKLILLIFKIHFTYLNGNLVIFLVQIFKEIHFVIVCTLKVIVWVFWFSFYR